MSQFPLHPNPQVQASSRVLFVGAASLAGLALLASAPAASAVEAPAAAASPVTSTLPAERESPRVVVTDTWTFVIDEPGVYLRRAHEELGAHRQSMAAGNLRKAAAMIDAESSRATSADDRTRLARDAAALQVVATQVEEGKIKDARLLDEQLARVRSHLAGHHYARAMAAWTDKKLSSAGASIAAAGRYVEGGLRSVGLKASADLGRAVRYGEHLAKTGAADADADFDHAAKTIDGELSRLDRTIEARAAMWPRHSPFDQGA